MTIRHPSQRLARRAVTVVLLAAATTLAAGAAGCSSVSDLRFTQDHRVTLTSPTSGTDVTLPFTMTWTVQDFDVQTPGGPVRPGSGHFGVFVDTLPMAPGESLRDFVGAKACGAVPDCPTPDLLARLNVYSTDKTSLEIPRVGAGLMGSEGHQLILVLLDADGRRMGDSFWRTSFQLAGTTQASR